MKPYWTTKLSFRATGVLLLLIGFTIGEMLSQPLAGVLVGVLVGMPIAAAVASRRLAPTAISVVGLLLTAMLLIAGVQALFYGFLVFLLTFAAWGVLAADDLRGLLDVNLPRALAYHLQYPLNNSGGELCAIPHLVKGGAHRQAVPGMVGCSYD